MCTTNCVTMASKATAESKNTVTSKATVASSTATAESKNTVTSKATSKAMKFSRTSVASESVGTTAVGKTAVGKTTMQSARGRRQPWPWGHPAATSPARLVTPQI